MKRKRYIVAIDSLKGCLTSREAGEAARDGILTADGDAEVIVLPVSDGGEGMLDAYVAALGASVVTVPAHDALGRPLTARLGITRDGATAIIESAEAIGLTLLHREERDPMRTTTRGVGEMMLAAIERGCRRLLIGLGGSATSDCGLGMLEALGARVGDDSVDVSNLPSGIDVVVACDVDNPLYGPCGAAAVYGPQKGASAGQVSLLDDRARRFADLCRRATGRDCSAAPGAGAAGGLGYALMQFFGAKMTSGGDLMLHTLDFKTRLNGATSVITGEGSADRQTLMGKLPYRIMTAAKQRGVPTALIAGRVSDRDALLDAGFDVVKAINPPSMPLEQCMRRDVARANLAATAASLLDNM